MPIIIHKRIILARPQSAQNFIRAAIFGLTIIASGCASHYVQPRLPLHKVALIEPTSPDDVSIKSIDGAPFIDEIEPERKLKILPGTRLIKVGLKGTTGFNALECQFEAGREYAMRREIINESKKFGMWAAWIIDINSQQNICQRK